MLSVSPRKCQDSTLNSSTMLPSVYLPILISQLSSHLMLYSLSYWQFHYTVYKYKSSISMVIIYCFIFSKAYKKNLNTEEGSAYFKRTFLRLIYVNITKYTYIWSWTVMKIMTRQGMGTVIHLVITKYILQQGGICSYSNFSTCT